MRLVKDAKASSNAKFYTLSTFSICLKNLFAEVTATLTILSGLQKKKKKQTQRVF